MSGGWEVRAEGGVARLCSALRPRKEGSRSVAARRVAAVPPPLQGAAGASPACCRFPAVSPASAAAQPASARPYGRRGPLGACPPSPLCAPGGRLQPPWLFCFVSFALLFFLSLFNSFSFSPPPPPPPLPSPSPPPCLCAGWLAFRAVLFPPRRCLRGDRRAFVTERQPAIRAGGGGWRGAGVGDVKNNKKNRAVFGLRRLYGIGGLGVIPFSPRGGKRARRWRLR